ncbi:flagellar hook-associated protein FlgL [Acidisoma silvae]|uniref:Flagellar hook-associated protein FlgL n=1 Tax=Acidisoma silvae TaxID=2802396 RepID=A0A963YRD8_9PROT|nr:flagellar hook-associated protein FlgL [Acidisoma silvae]MCB8874925.1 flagellar hook-associated protein FlgL [Acidisoma silvae]
MSASLYTHFLANITQQEATVNTLEQQIASGYAVQSAAQNPGAFATATITNNQITALTTQNATQANIQTKLGTVSDSYTAVSTLYDTVQSVIEQALSGSSNAQDMQALSQQVSAAGQQLLGLANGTAPDGTYLFGGSRNMLVPFQTNADGTTVYLGDGGQGQAAISPDTTASTLASGTVFTNALAGNGYSVISADANNSGSGTLLATGIVQSAAAASFQSGTTPITLSFAEGDSGLTYTASQGDTVLATGSATSGTTLQLAGQSFQINGTPDAGDSFTIAPSRPQTAFALLQSIASALSATGSSSADRAQTTQALNGALSTLAQYQQTLLTAQAQNGVTLQAIASAGTSNSNQSTQLQLTVQNAVGVDMPSALTQLNETITAVAAAGKSFAAVQNLSLFQYL